jgi:hypothetical protein
MAESSRALIPLFNFSFPSSGWRGDSCSLPRCRDTCDPVGGTCSVPGGCECNLGYSGPNCDIGISYMNRCLNQKKCVFHTFLHLEGLGIKFAYTSSLAQVADYQNASIFFDVSENSGFSSYKVRCTHVALLPTASIDCGCCRFPSYRTTQARMISLLRYRDGTSAQSLLLR